MNEMLEGIMSKQNVTKPVELLRGLNQDPSPDRLSRYPKQLTKASRSRVLKLIRAITSAAGLLDAAVEAEPDRNFWTNTPSAVQEAIDKLQDLLDEYPMFTFVEIRGKYGEGGLHFSETVGGQRPQEEELAVWTVLNLAKSGHFSLLRECVCGRWFFAKRNDQMACTSNCRHKAYEQTESFKEKRREYMRKYYALKKTGKVK